MTQDPELTEDTRLVVEIINAERELRQLRFQLEKVRESVYLAVTAGLESRDVIPVSRMSDYPVGENMLPGVPVYVQIMSSGIEVVFTSEGQGLMHHTVRFGIDIKPSWNKELTLARLCRTREEAIEWLIDQGWGHSDTHTDFDWS